MKIVKQTSTKLIIQHLSVLLWMFGSIFVLAGLLGSVLFCKSTTLTCQRQLIEPTQGTCNLLQTEVYSTQQERRFRLIHYKEQELSKAEAMMIIIPTE